MERPSTPPDQILRPNLTTPPPAPLRKRAVPRISSDIKDQPPPSYGANFNKPADFEVPPLKGGDFKEFPTQGEWADKLGLKLPSGESIISGRPKPSELEPGAKLPSSLEKLDRCLEVGDVDPMSLSGMSSVSEPKSKPEAFVKSAEDQQEMADQNHLKPSSQGPKKLNSEFGLMLPPPLKVPGGQQKKQTSKPSSEVSGDAKEQTGIPQRLLKGADLLQEMADVENPQQAEEGCAKVFMDRLPIVQAVSRRFQGHLGMYGDTTWPLPPLPENRNVFILETNAMKIRAALEDCSAFAVTTDRESGKSEYLDVKVKYCEKRVVIPAAQAPTITSFEDEKKASKAEASDTVAQMMEEGLQEGLKELEDEGESGKVGEAFTFDIADYNAEAPSTPKPLFHSFGSTPANNSSQNSLGSNIAAGENEELEPASQGAIATGENEELDPASQEVIATGENEELDPASQEVRSENTAERERRERREELTSDPHFVGIGPAGPEYEDNDEGKEKVTSSNFNEQVKNKQWILRHIRDARENARQGCLGEPIGLGREKLDVAGSLHNHSLTFIQSKGRSLNPPVPQPDKMPDTLTAAICSYVPLEAKSILTLTLERVDSPIASPTQHRCVLLKHFEVGLDGIEGLCQGTAKIPETPEVAAERERRVGKIGMFKQGGGGFYKALKCAQQKDQLYGKGYWYFFGVKFKQTSKERKAKMGGKWFLFGAPIEAVDHLDIRTTQENINIVLGGVVDGSGTAIQPFTANFKRTYTLFSKGGIAPMDIWPGGDDWDDGVFGDIRAAMANHGLRVGFLYADSQSFTPKPSGFPAAGKNQDEKKRKQPGPDMTEEEMKAMEKSMAPRRLSEEIGAKLVTKIINDRAKADAASRSM